MFDLTAQENVERFCRGSDNCLSSSLELVFGDVRDGPSILELPSDATEVFTTIVLDTRDEKVGGWSCGIAYDPAVFAPGEDPCEDGIRFGTMFQCETDAGAAVIPPHFNVSTFVEGDPDGAYPPGFISAMVPGGAAASHLPSGRRNSIARVPFRVVGAPPPEGTLLRFVDGLVRNSPSPPVAINVSTDGRAKLPETLVHGLVLPATETVAEVGPARCSDRVDNDGDGLIDAEEEVCNSYRRFVRGDVEAVGGVGVGEAVWIVGVAAGSARPPVRCLEALDADNDDGVRITDGVLILHWFFLRGPPPSSPFPDCGLDPSIETLGCFADHPYCG